jgi:hypothetical protein
LTELWEEGIEFFEITLINSSVLIAYLGVSRIVDGATEPIFDPTSKAVHCLHSFCGV